MCDSLSKHLEAGIDPDITSPKSEFTAFRVCFIEGKTAAMRLLLKAGAKTTWTEDQVAIAVGETPESPSMGNEDAFLFACRVGNLEAARTYCPYSEAGREKDSKAVFEAIRAHATEVVAWLMDTDFDPNAVNDCGWSALELATDDNDTGIAEVLLAAGADALGSPEKEHLSPVANAVSERMRTLFVRFGISPARFEYATNPEDTPLTFLAEKILTQEAFDANRCSREGSKNPERFLPDFWYEQMRTGRSSAPRSISYEMDRTKPVWSFNRFGRTVTPLPDGRLILIGGEHEDHYHPNFCIYSDVTVLDGRGRVEHFIYPDDMFPPIDHHAATVMGDSIWIIGALGYPERRRDGATQVLRLDLNDFSIQPVETTGEMPGWIHGHRAIADGTKINIAGGRIEPSYHFNESTFQLETNSLIWQKIYDA